MQNKVAESGNIGKIKKCFDNGASDARRAGLLLNEEPIHADGATMEQSKESIWQLCNKNFINSDHNIVGQSHSLIRPTSSDETLMEGFGKANDSASTKGDEYSQRQLTFEILGLFPHTVPNTFMANSYFDVLGEMDFDSV